MILAGWLFEKIYSIVVVVWLCGNHLMFCLLCTKQKSAAICTFCNSHAGLGFLISSSLGSGDLFLTLRVTQASS